MIAGAAQAPPRSAEKMFKEILKDVVDNTEGGVASLLMGFDGIPVDQYVREGEGFDVETVGMEYSVILKNIRNAAQMLEAGDAQEVSVQAERVTTVIRLLNDEYFLAIALRPSGNLGKARFLLRTRGTKLLSDLE
ncbi:MAG: putative regulator of Ras-like GTPase activity (Roadblock/LC7/MglB family) [Polyangiales bacterium]|jgi:predicted regulator of Ras-like GTPase activity (Roadblock/LC7/MglB family)